MDDGSIKRAFLTLHNPEKDGHAMGPVTKRFDFAFNPKELTVQRTADWKNDAKKKGQPPEYNGAKGGSVTLEMFLDASGGGTVKTVVDDLLKTVLPAEGTTKKDKPVGPYVSFGWGAQTYVPCAVVKSISAKYTRFDATGAAIRAVVTITLEEVMPSIVKQNPTSGALGAYAVHVLRSGDSLASLANNELGTPTRWRAIAIANGIDDPFRLRPGRAITIPTSTSFS
jgi:Contractile injection system tube protein/LysM domain